MFPHNEYHIYTTNDSLEKAYVHLTETELSAAQELHELPFSASNDWQTIHRLDLGNNVHLAVGDGLNRGPSLQSRGYEGWIPVDDGDFEEELFFDTTIFYKCIGERGFEPEWSFAEVKEWVNYEHRAQFEKEFDEYLTEQYNPDGVIVDW